MPIWRPQEGLLTQLLRKKLDPETETWIQAGADASSLAESTNGTAGTGSAPQRVDAVKLDNTWTSAAGKAREIFAQIPWNSNFTIAEREGEGGVSAINTGLKKDLAADEESDDEDEDDDEDDEDEDGEGDAKDEETGRMDEDEKEGLQKRAEPRPPMEPLEDVLRFASIGVLRRPVPTNAGGRPQ